MGIHGCASTRTLATLFVIAVTVSVSASASGRVALEDRVARMRFEYLATRSTTMKQMLAVIETTPRIFVRVRALYGLRDPRLSGHGTFHVNAEGIHAVLEFDVIYTKLWQQLEMVAHEVAHVVEVACLAPPSGDLRRVLLRRGFSVRQQAGRIAIETPFAADAGRRVVVEAMRGGTHPGQLHKLAGQYELGPPCTVAPPEAGFLVSR